MAILIDNAFTLMAGKALLLINNDKIKGLLGIVMHADCPDLEQSLMIDLIDFAGN